MTKLATMPDDSALERDDAAATVGHDVLECDAAGRDAAEETRAASNTSPQKPWRKRHPVLARAILYSLGIALGLGLYLMLEARKKSDAAHAIEVDSKFLENMPLLLAKDPTGRKLEFVIDEEFEGREVADHIGSRVERWRAIAFRSQKRYADAESALDRARALTSDAACLDAIALERAYVRLAEGDFERALDALGQPSLRPVTDPLNGLELVVRAGVLEKLGQRADAERALRSFVDATPDTLKRRPVRRAGGREWTSRGTIAIVFETLANFVSPSESLDIWKSLHKRAGRDYNVQLSCTRAFLKRGKQHLAERSWTLARDANPIEAAKVENKYAEYKQLR